MVGFSSCSFSFLHPSPAPSIYVHTSIRPKKSNHVQKSNPSILFLPRRPLPLLPPPPGKDAPMEEEGQGVGDPQPEETGEGLFIIEGFFVLFWFLGRLIGLGGGAGGGVMVVMLPL